MRRSLLAGGILSVALLTIRLGAGSVPAGKPEDVGVSSERLKRISETVQRHIDAHDVAGAVTLVARRGKIVAFEAQGLADIESKRPMAKDGIFRLASMTKPVTGVAVMMMVEEGKVRLTDRVSQFIPEFRNLNKVAIPSTSGAKYDTVPATREITIRDLTHGSGLVSGGVGAAAAPSLAPRTPADTLATYVPKLAAVPLDFQPGMLWRYSSIRWE